MAEEFDDDGADDLQFSAVEGATPGQVVNAPQCVVCKRPIVDAYFTAGDKVICPECRNQYEASLQKGSKFGRFLKATVLGILAGLVGAAVWFGIRYATEKDFALVAIGVGLLVGGAVRLGSGRRGGRGYQFLAVLLTYLAVGLAFVPDIVIAGYKKFKEMDQTQNKPLVARDGATTMPATRMSAATQEAIEAKTQPTTRTASGGLDDEDSDDSLQKPPTGKQLAVAVLVMLIAAAGVVLIGPVLVAFSSIIGAIIVGIALWEAWKINASRRLSLAGPYSMAGTPPAPGGPTPGISPGPRR